MFKSIHRLKPHWLNNNILMACENHDRNTRFANNMNVVIPKPNDETSRNIFRLFAFCHIWVYLIISVMWMRVSNGLGFFMARISSMNSVCISVSSLSLLKCWLCIMQVRTKLKAVTSVYTMCWHGDWEAAQRSHVRVAWLWCTLCLMWKP